MNYSALIFGERRPWQVAALFDDEQEARQAAEAVLAEERLQSDQARTWCSAPRGPWSVCWLRSAFMPSASRLSSAVRSTPPRCSSSSA